MKGDLERKDEKESRILLIGLGILALVLVIVGIFAAPMLADLNQQVFAPGMNLKESAMLALVISIVVMVIFAVAAGDGLIGEIQYMLIGFFAFFLLLWLMIAWVF